MNLDVHYLNGGYCTQILAAVDGRSLRKVRFNAVFLAIRHPREGWTLCDTGYGNSFFEASKTLPRCLYRFATPVTLRGTASTALAGIGVRADDVRHLIITHFHADHVGGLREFPNATLHYRSDALQPLQALSSWRQTKAAFLPDLIPESIGSHSREILPPAFLRRTSLPFRTFDLFGDGSLNLVYLPGHAPGQIGIEYMSKDKRFLYCADAFWRSEQIFENVELPRLTRSFQWDAAAYQETIMRLRELHAQGSHILTGCHDERTQQYVCA